MMLLEISLSLPFGFPLLWLSVRIRRLLPVRCEDGHQQLQASAVPAWQLPREGCPIPRSFSALGLLLICLGLGTPLNHSLERGVQLTDLPQPTVGELYPNTVGERWPPKENEVAFPEKGRWVLSGQKRWLVSHRPDPNLLRPR